MLTRRTIVLGMLALTVLSAVFTWYFYRFALDIEGVVETAGDEPFVDSSAAAKPVVYISVISRYPPNVINSGYQPMLDYMTSRTAYRFELKLCTDYYQAVDMLLRKEAAAAFLGSYVYIRAREEHGVIPILKPLNRSGKPYSRSVLFTGSATDIYSIRDLKGKRLALPSEESYSSNWLLHYEFRRNNIRPSELAEIRNFPHHQGVIQQVTAGNFDAGVTREHLIRKIQSRNIRILLYSDPFPTSPIVVARDHSPDVVRAIKEALLAVGRDGRDRATVTRGWDQEFIHGFVEATDGDYDAVRAIAQR